MMKYAPVLGLCLLLSPLHGVADASDIAVVLHERAMIDGATYSLADIAEISAPTPEIVALLSGVDMGRAPRFGYSELIKRERVRTHAERSVPQLKGKIAWEGASQIRISTAGTRVATNAYLDVAKQSLESWLSEHVVDYRVTVKGTHKDIVVPQGEVAVTARVQPGAAISKRMGIWLDVEVDGEHYQSVPVWFAVDAYADALVAEYDLDNGIDLNNGMFAVQRVDLAEVDAELLLPSTDLSDMRLRLPVGMGQPLRVDAVARKPDISQGQVVEVLSQVGSVSITATATALEDGFVGDRLEVQKLGSDMTYMVRVTGDGAASISRVNR